MRKPFQVLLPDSRALLLVRQGQCLLLDPWGFRLPDVSCRAGSLCLRFPACPGARGPRLRVRPAGEQHARQAKLRLLAPALRQALQAAAP